MNRKIEPMNYPKNLDQSELAFLKHHKILPSDLFDCNGITVQRFKNEMRAAGKIVGYNSTTCNSGHRIKMRSGHCPVWKPIYIEMQKRNEKSGYLIVSYSKHGRLFKIGFSENYEKRADSVNYTFYGGFDDWETVMVFHSSKAGRLKNAIKSDLKAYSESGVYFHDGDFREAIDMYSCDFQEIDSVLGAYSGLYKVEAVLPLYDELG